MPLFSYFNGTQRLPRSVSSRFTIYQLPFGYTYLVIKQLLQSQSLDGNYFLIVPARNDVNVPTYQAGASME